MVWLFLLPFILGMLYFISMMLSALSLGMIPVYVYFILFICISIYLFYRNKNKKLEIGIEKTSSELKITDKEEECPNCHKMSEKRFNACEYCATIKHEK